MARRSTHNQQHNHPEGIQRGPDFVAQLLLALAVVAILYLIGKGLLYLYQALVSLI